MASKFDAGSSKEGITATVTAVAAEEPSVVEEQRPKPAHDYAQAIWAIIGGVALPCIPIIVITTILLYYIFRHQLILSPGWPALQAPVTHQHKNATDLINLVRQQGGDKAYYVAYNASTITTIASWTGRIVPYLSSSIMALVAFYAARHIVVKSKHGDGTDLPSPEQLTILISVLGGSGFGPLRDTLLYRYGKKEKLLSPLPAAFSALFIITFLGILIPFVDSWFGIATKTVIVTQLYPGNSTLSYGRDISKTTCPNGPREDVALDQCFHDSNIWWPCNIINPTCHGPILNGQPEAAAILNGASRQHQLFNYTDSSGLLFHYLGAPGQNNKVDYQAKTIAVSSQCSPMTQRCLRDTADQEYNPFTCTPAFTGNLYTGYLNTSAQDDEFELNSINVGLVFAEDAQLTRAGGVIDAYHIASNDSFPLPEIYQTNPLHYGSWAIGFPPADQSATTAPPFTGDTGIYYNSGSSEGGVWLLNCSTTVYEVTYTWVNGAVQQFNHSLASTDMGALMSGPFAQRTSYTDNALMSIANVAGINNNSHAIAASFAAGFSQALLAYSNDAWAPVLNEYEQGRNATISVARIPMVPLYLLLCTKAVYVLAVIILAIGAYCFTHPAETEIVKAQLSMKGLAAAHFQQPDLARQNVVKELQNRIDAAKGKSQPAPEMTSEEREQAQHDADQQSAAAGEKGLRRAATAPALGADAAAAAAATTHPKDTKVGLMPGADGAWQFVVLANGVWNSIKPIVENIVVNDAKAGGLGTTGQFIGAWK